MRVASRPIALCACLRWLPWRCCSRWAHVSAEPRGDLRRCSTTSFARRRLSLRNQMGPATTIELPPEQSDGDLVIQVSDLFGSTVYASRPGPADRSSRKCSGTRRSGLRRAAMARLWAADTRQRHPGRAAGSRERGARRVRARVAHRVPLLLLIPLMGVAIFWVVGGALAPLRRAAAKCSGETRTASRRSKPSQLPHEDRAVGAGAQSPAGSPRRRVRYATRVRRRCRARVAFAAHRGAPASAAAGSCARRTGAHARRAPVSAQRWIARFTSSSSCSRLRASEPREATQRCGFRSARNAVPRTQWQTFMHSLQPATSISSLDKEADVRVQGQPGGAAQFSCATSSTTPFVTRRREGRCACAVGEIAGAPDAAR